MRRLKLCFLGWGDHVHVERWAGHFAALGHSVSVLSVSGEGRYPPGVRQHVLRLSRSRAAVADAELRLLLWRLQPDVLHVHWAHFAVAAARAWSGPLVVTAWGSDIYREEVFSDAEKTALAGAMSRADAVTCDSDDLAQTLAQRYGNGERVHVIQWGVDTELFKPGPSPLAAELGIADRPVVFSARNFVPVYNQETVVEAFALARKSVPSAFLLMKRYGGDEAYVQSIRDRLRRLGLENDSRIVDAVAYDRMPELYRAAAVTVSVPHSDAMPMSVFEAMACHSLPVASDLPSLREWIAPGVNGYLVPATDTGSVARAIVDGL